MKRVSILLFSLLLFFSLGFSQGKEYTFQFTINGMEFDSIRMVAVLGSHNVRIAGERVDANCWKCQVPDSVFQKFFWLKLVGDEGGWKGLNLCFLTPDSPVFGVDALGFSDKAFQPIEMTLVKDEVFMEDFAWMPMLDCLSTPLFYRDCLFRIEPFKTDRDIEISFQYVMDYLNWPMAVRAQKLEEAIRAYPDLYMLARIMKFTYKHLAPSDVLRLCPLFSERIQSTYLRPIKAYAEQKIRYERSLFRNRQLPDWKTGKPEYIVADAKKYTLVVFSTSWCGPCHKLIPYLKSLHRDLGDKLDIVYVSGDREKTIPDWRKLMVDEQIPWRSVLACSGEDDAIADYFVTIFPTCLLVHPGGQFEKYNIWDADSRARLVKLVSGKM